MKNQHNVISLNNNYKRACNYKKTSKTLDYCHKNNIETFINNKTSLNDKYKKLSTLTTELN